MAQDSCYLLFENYTHGLDLHKKMKACGIESRISPTPPMLYSDKLCCGMALLVNPECAAQAEEFVKEHEGCCLGIKYIPCQINPKRNRFC